jgi:hypothetical protein
VTQSENKKIKFHLYLISTGVLFILFSMFSIMPVASQGDSKPTLYLTQVSTRPPRLNLTPSVPAASSTPIPSPTETGDDVTPDRLMIETTGLVYYQNREISDLPIEIRILNEDLVLLSTTQADPTGTYQILIPADQFFWLEVDAPLHRLIRIGINPGQSLPDIRLVGGDLNGDACVGASDMALMIQNFDRNDAPDTDITGDGLTDASDLAILAGNFQPECEALPPYVMASPTPTPDVNTPTPAQNTISVPFYDAFDSDTGWLANGAWRFDTAYDGTGWFADSTQRGLLSILQAVYQFDLSTPVHLVFWEKAALASNDRVAVSISLDEGMSWVLLDEQTGPITDWTRRALDLTTFQGQVIQLRFTVDTTLELAENEATTGYWIDNLSLEPPQPTDTETPTSTPTPEGPTVTPTPPDTATPTLTPTPLPVVLPFIDSFDSGLGWLADGTWQLDIETAFNGASWFADNTQFGKVSRLEFGGLIDLTTALNPQLQFWQHMWLNPADQFSVEVSLDGGISWSLVERQNGVRTDWTLHVLDLSLYRGYPIKLRFTLDTTESYPETPKLSGCWIDELLIQDSPTIVTPTPVETDIVTPTPVTTDIVTPTPITTDIVTPTPVATDTATAPSTDTPTFEPSATTFVDVTPSPLPTVSPTQEVLSTPTPPQAPPRAANSQSPDDKNERGD